ncbi:MAG TPA: GNAT family protein [Ignavibacteriaceae bacterium]|nr:GNAT family protein [Ignavibacteriaceae bacterium]
MEFSFSEHIILENDFALLRPLEKNDFDGLSQIAYDYDIWKFNVSRCMNDEELNEYITRLLEMRENGVLYPFVIIDKSKNQTAGSTSFGNISNKDRRLEIGGTWLGKRFQGTGLNKSCKYLLLKFVFEQLGFERAEFKTDVLNQQSRKALMKNGTQEEGILRSHTVMQDGRRRDTIYYSILEHEWEDIKNQRFSNLI